MFITTWCHGINSYCHHSTIFKLWNPDSLCWLAMWLALFQSMLACLFGWFAGCLDVRVIACGWLVGCLSGCLVDDRYCNNDADRGSDAHAVEQTRCNKTCACADCVNVWACMSWRWHSVCVQWNYARLVLMCELLMTVREGILGVYELAMIIVGCEVVVNALGLVMSVC